jgi:hypothetical protein
VSWPAWWPRRQAVAAGPRYRDGSPAPDQRRESRSPTAWAPPICGA